MKKVAKPRPLGDRVVERVQDLLDGYLKDPVVTETMTVSTSGILPRDVVQLVDTVLAYRRKSYRDGLIIQTAFGLEAEELAERHTIRPEGGRRVAERIGIMFSERHIEGVVDAYQNIAKNSDSLTRGNLVAFDDALRWLDVASPEDRETALHYVLARTALTARNVLPMPDVDAATLTFHGCAVFLDALLKIPSGGAYQQFAAAALLHAVIEEAGQGGRNGLRVETKRLNATDASSRVPGDIQIMRAQRVEEAFEVTANDWRTKVASAVKTMKEADLPRIHILATVEAAFPDKSELLEATGLDITVIDVSAFLRTMVATMRKPARAAALVRLYELIERYQPDTERVNAYVRLLLEHKLAHARTA